MELLLLTGLLESLTAFLDEEEKYGFLQQDVVDKLLAVESMINELIFGITHKQEHISKELPPQELMYVPFLDEMDEQFTHKASHELEF